MACAQINYRKKGISLLVHARHSTLSIFSSWFSLSSLFLLFLILSLFFSFFLNTSMQWCCDSLLVVTIAVMMILCTARVFYIQPTVIGFYHFSFWVLLSSLCVLVDHASLSAVQPPPLTYTGYATPHYQTKKIILFACSLWHSYPP